MSRGSARTSFVALLAAAACGAAPATAPAPVPTDAAQAPSGAAAPTGESMTPLLMLTDGPLLDALAASGLDAATRAFELPANGSAFVSAAALGASPRFARVRQTLIDDVAAIRRADRQAGVGLAFAHRLFDPTWLSRSDVGFRLVAVAVRLDRQPFAPAQCGELRLVYRLGAGRAVSGDPAHAEGALLPFTLNVVHFIAAQDGACSTAARRYVRPHADSLPAQVAALRAADGPLADAAFAPSLLKSLEVNAQVVRWPATVRPDLGGHAEYVLRAFSNGADGLAPLLLENTPDVDAIQRTPALAAQLRAFVLDASTWTDAARGLSHAPPALLATRAVTVTPGGLARAQNRPWSRLLQDGALAAEVRARGGDPAALGQALDGQSCQGCHAARSIAGFHIVGAARASDAPVDALAVALSPHAAFDLERRDAYARALMSGTPTNPARLLPDAPHTPARFGEACTDTRAAPWPCAAGLRCVDALARATAAVASHGVCLPVAPETGSACTQAELPRVLAPERERATHPVALPCRASDVCEAVGVGFPSGMCSGGCDTLDAHGRCGAIAILTPFNACLARGETFATCAAFTRPGALRACDDEAPCRDDYVCKRLPDGTGGCLPPYFALQMRVDGHVLPRHAALPKWQDLLDRPRPR